MRLIPDGKKVPLWDMDPGLFLFDDCLALKTEYISASGRIEAYIVDTGEFFHGGTKTAEDQRSLMVQPVEVDFEEKQATSQATSDESKRFAEDTNVPSNDVPDTNVGKWISVKERLPEHLKDVLVVASDGYDTFVETDFLLIGGSWVLDTGGRRVTHWMPMPDLPKGE